MRGNRKSASSRISTQSDSIGPLDIRLHQNLSVDSVHAGLLNLGRLPPVGPVQKPGVSTHDIYETERFASVTKMSFLLTRTMDPQQWRRVLSGLG